MSPDDEPPEDGKLGLSVKDVGLRDGLRDEDALWEFPRVKKVFLDLMGEGRIR